MQDAVNTALKQIENKNYADEFVYADVKNIIKIGIAFCGKNVSLGYDF